MKKMSESSEARNTKYWIRMIKRQIRLVFWVFILFLLIMAIIWVAPQVWNKVMG